jgi:rhomboid protease GluP
LPLPLRWRWKLDRWRENLGFLFGSKQEQARPKLCPACGTLVGANAARCHQCGASMTFSLAAASRSLSQLMPATAPVTYAILTLSCLFYGVSLLATIHLGGGLLSAGAGGNPLALLMRLGSIEPHVLVNMGAASLLYFDFRQPWRLVMAIFLHGSLLHIGFNMWVLMDIGPMVEELYGSARYLFLYVVTGVAGYVLSGLVGHPVSIGASGSLLGLVGLLLAVTSRRGGAAMQMLRGQLIIWVVGIFLLGFWAQGIDNAAHLGGLIAGFLLGRIVADREPATVSERKRAQALGWLTAMVVLASFVAMVFSYFNVI